MRRTDNRVSQLGLTLVELLIVISLVALTASLVSPTVGRQLEQAQARDELQTLRRLVASIGFEAYAKSQEFTVTTDGSALLWSSPVGRGERIFERLFFPRRVEVTFNANGVANHQELTVNVGSKTQTIRLNTWIQQ
jgi:prepilin-type N-terminal cleavage/methylation domain-containing protein